MNSINRMRAAIAGILILFGVQMPVSAQQPQAEPFAIASNRFATDLYAQIRGHAGNQCVSPYSVSSILAMTSIGAHGDTASQMLSTLHWTLPPEQLVGDVADLSHLLVPAIDEDATARERERNPEVAIANSLWVQTGLSLEKPFLTSANHDFAAPVQEVGFNGDPELVRSNINAWVSNATRKRIPDALPAGTIGRSTRLVLVNTVYFKAAWSDEFNTSATEQQSFHLDGGATADVPLMQQRHHFKYAENDQFQLVELPYTQNYSMVIILPRTINGLPAVESTFSAGSFDRMVNAAGWSLVELYLPKFKMNCQYNLNGPLGAMGMKDAFTPAADFSGISKSDRLMIDAVSHSTFIAIDELGTEATAATSVTMRTTAMRMQKPEEVKIVRADHPFLFVIRHDQTGAILFMGRVADPR